MCIATAELSWLNAYLVSTRLYFTANTRVIIKKITIEMLSKPSLKFYL